MDEMSEAIGRALGDDKLMLSKLAAGNYFRIHDSGDFYGSGAGRFAYFDAWVQVILRFPQVRFWAPTRMWVFPDWRAHMIGAFQSLGQKLSNFALRPSALIYGTRAPMIHGLPAGSTAASIPMEPMGHWDCPAYKSLEGSCVGSCCRTCWDRPDVPVNYHVH